MEPYIAVFILLCPVACVYTDVDSSDSVKKNPIMATMNAYGWVKHGGAEAMKLLTVLRPTTPGPGEVLIKLKVGPHV